MAFLKYSSASNALSIFKREGFRRGVITPLSRCTSASSSALAGLLDCGYRLLDRFKGLSDLPQTPVNLRQRDEKLWPIYPGPRRSIDVKVEYLGNPLLVLSLSGQSPSSKSGLQRPERTGSHASSRSQLQPPQTLALPALVYKIVESGQRD